MEYEKKVKVKIIFSSKVNHFKYPLGYLKNAVWQAAPGHCTGPLKDKIVEMMSGFA